MSVTISSGFALHDRPVLAALYWQAFGPKLGCALGPAPRALAFLQAVLDPDHALVARDGTGTIIGVAGFKTREGAFVGGGLREMRRIYGNVGALWRGVLLSVLDREVTVDVLLMDGICVSPAARGQGVGTALLDAIKRKTSDLGKTAVRLDVINNNPRARGLYLREGFVPGDVMHMGPLRYVFGFDSGTTMVWHSDAKRPRSRQRSELTSA